MNPFDFTGPQFLVFYVVFAASVLVALWIVGRISEGGELGEDTDDCDPYSVAYLRGGHRAALQAACVSLCARGLMSVQMSVSKTGAAKLALAREDALALVRDPLETAVLECAQRGDRADEMLESTRTKQATSKLRAELEARQLKPDASQRFTRGVRLGIAVALLIGVALTKIVVAAGRGRTNVEFLVALTFFATIGAAALVRRPRTARGDRTLASLGTLFAGLRTRAKSLAPRESGHELALLAALYGVHAVPASVLPARRWLETKRDRRDHGTSSSACSTLFGGTCGASSCGSSSGGGSSCGSSCGGGGGCGGCGGD